MDFHNPKNLYLCIDQGGHASRAIVFNHLGETIVETYEDIHAEHTEEGYIQYDAKTLLASIRKILTQVKEQLGPRISQVSAAGLATQRSNVVCWDAYSGQAISPIISWQDRRGADQLKQYSNLAGEIHQTSGLFLSPHYGASKIQWCLENLPEVKNAFKRNSLRYGPMASFLTHQLLQERPCLTDPVNAARTQLMNIKTQDWDPTLLTTFNLSRESLPQIKPTYHAYGSLVDTDMIPLQIVTGDQAAAMFAYGAIQPNTAYVNIGTGAFISRPSGPVLTFGRRLLTSIILNKTGNSEFVLEGTVNGSGSALDWFANEFKIDNLTENLPNWLDDENIEEAFFLNGISGLGAPFWISNFPSRFDGSTDTPSRAVAIVESIVFLIKASMDEMLKFSSPPEQIQLSGGLAQLDGLCSRLASLTGLAVYRPISCEATARGTAYLLAGSPKHWPEPNPGDWFEQSNNTAISKRYEAWLQLMLDTMRK